MNCKTVISNTPIKLLCNNFMCSTCLINLIESNQNRLKCISSKISHNLGKYYDLYVSNWLNVNLNIFNFDDDLFNNNNDTIIIKDNDLNDSLINDTWSNKLIYHAS